MIDVVTTPKNQQHFSRLMAFTHEVLDVCQAVGITPILSASLAVFAYTQDTSMEVHDIDLSCSEAQFPRLCQELEAKGISCRVTRYHVLQAVGKGLKVEFDAAEYWMRDIPARYERAQIGDLQFWMVGIDELQELYRRGLVDTADKADPNNQIKYRSIKAKLGALEALRTERH